VVATVEQVTTAGAQLVGEVERGHALAEAAKDHDQATGWVSNALQRGAGVEVEDPPAFSTTIVENGRPMAVVRGLIARQRMSVGAPEPLGMEGFQQHSVAALLVEQILDGKEHHANNRSTSPTASSTASVTAAASSVGSLHPDGPMSRASLPSSATRSPRSCAASQHRRSSRPNSYPMELGPERLRRRFCTAERIHAHRRWSTKQRPRTVSRRGRLDVGGSPRRRPAGKRDVPRGGCPRRPICLSLVRCFPWIERSGLADRDALRCLRTVPFGQGMSSTGKLEHYPAPECLDLRRLPFSG